jgi:hypothetical protein
MNSTRSNDHRSRNGVLRKYGYFWVTVGLFALSLAGHWAFGWKAYVEEAGQLGQPVEKGHYAMQMVRDTLENWQSEFLQLIWLVAGLTFICFVGSAQLRAVEERLEAKMDVLMDQSAAGHLKRMEIDKRLRRT